MEGVTVTVIMITLLSYNRSEVGVAEVEKKTLAEVKETRDQEGSGRISHLDVEMDHEELK